jgi:ribonuclease BN (tRNA processing enzyme)
VHIDELPSHLVFHDVPDTEWELGSVTVRADLVKHPGPTLGYRVEDNGKVLTYISDHEPALGIDLDNVPPDWISGYGLAERADVLLHDAQYTEEEYPKRVGWGHSSVAHTISFALIAKVQRLLMFHHDPLHSDTQLDAMLARARELWGPDRDGLALSFEGMEIDIS